MKKLVITLCLIVNLILVGCTSNIEPVLTGTYQSDGQGMEYIVQIAFQPDDNSYVEYISSREVDRGTYEKVKDNIYRMKSDHQNFEITLDVKDSFEIIIDKINNGKPIELKNISDTPVYSTTKYDDVGEYKALLNKR